MNKFFRKNIFLILLLIGGGIFRFTYINWGYPFFFHPDENNITTAVMHLSFTQWNPHFFAYGDLPIYTGFLLSSLASLGKPSFLEITYTLRSVSAILSFLLIPSLFYIGSRMYSKSVGFIAALLAAVSIGFIQYAHFGTFEMWLTFFSLWLFYVCFLFLKHPSKKYALLLGIAAGIVVSVKVSSVVLLPIPIGVFLFTYRKSYRQLFASIILYSACVLAVFSITNPFLFLDMNSYVSALSYESSVAIGTLPVFYTQSFLHTIPIIFQFTKVYPFLLNPIVFFFFLFSFFFLLWEIKNHKHSQDILLIVFFLITFLSQAFLFVKWTRYMLPTLPFMYLCIALVISRLKPRMMFFSTLGLFCISLLFAISFFITVYPKDSRIAASAFPKIEQAALVEPYDLGAIAFTQSFPDSKMLNLYDLEKDANIQEQLSGEIHNDGIFLSPSQRLLSSRLENTEDFPKGHAFYTNLFNGLYGYTIVYTTPCDILCKITYVGDPIYNVEETATVFDHPFVTIFQKNEK